MKMGTYTEAYELVAPGERRLELLGIEQRDTNPEFLEYDEKGNVKNPYRWRWSWAVVKGSDLGTQFSTWTNATIGKGSTAAPIVEALLGRPMKTGEELDTDDIVGKQIDCYVSDKGPKGGNKNTIVNPRPAGQKQLPGTEKSAAQQAVEAGSVEPLFADDGEGKALAGYPRRVMAASTALKARGVTQEAIKARIAAIVGNDKPFKEQTPADQAVVVGWLEGWASDFDSYDETGDVNF